MKNKTDDRFLHHLNRSKKRDSRFWRDGRKLGLVADANVYHTMTGRICEIRVRPDRSATVRQMKLYAERHELQLMTREDLETTSPPTDHTFTFPSVPSLRFERGNVELDFDDAWNSHPLAFRHFGE